MADYPGVIFARTVRRPPSAVRRRRPPSAVRRSLARAQAAGAGSEG
ncbi:MAG TPA: hypothetical protein VHO07_09290 [Streptosporangiaceae bacterium]|nr:hypothetical protein [Streptosporangiaceae bacterium]